MPGASSPNSLAHHLRMYGSRTFLSTSSLNPFSDSSRDPSRMVNWPLRSTDGPSLTSWRVLTVCSRIDCILGPHWSHNPLQIRTTESAVRSLSEKIAESSRFYPRRSFLVGKVDKAHPVDDGLRHVFKERLHQGRRGGSTTMMASSSLPAAFSFILWTTTCCMRVDLPMRVLAT